jgi:Na+/H+ antiporter NhaD/arsenite permease-like protein
MPLELGVFLIVYVGMMLGRLPGLALDRTGIALLGAIALVASGRVAPRDAWQAVDVGTIGLLLGLMVVSGQFHLGGVYALVTRRIAEAGGSPGALLALVIAAAAVLSALLVNDVVCLALAPLLIRICARRGLAPVPFLLALACASNVGSAATLIGNPQNMLIGQTLDLSFSGYLLDSAVPSALGLGVIWLVLRHSAGDPWAGPVPPEAPSPGFDPWQAARGAAVLAVVVAVFLLTDWPREVVALSAAGLLMVNRTLDTRKMLEPVDWPLLVLFAGLFIVNHALAAGGMLERMTQRAAEAGLDLDRPAVLFAAAVVLSNLVSNVPAVMLLLPASDHALAGPILALASTLAGNLILVGSIANLIVVDQAALHGVRISWRAHARAGVPVTLGTLAIAAVWLWLRATALA